MDVPLPVIIVVGLALVTLILIIVAPWRRVRAERPLPSDLEARVLLGEKPREIDANDETRDESTADSSPPTAS